MNKERGFIDNNAYRLRVESAKARMSGYRSRTRSRSRRSRLGQRRTRSRNALEYFNPENFKAIEMNYGETPNPPDCSELTEKITTLQNELNVAKEEIDKVNKKLIECQLRKGEDCAEIIRRLKHPKKSEGGKRITKKRNYKK